MRYQGVFRVGGGQGKGKEEMNMKKAEKSAKKDLFLPP